MSEAEEITEEAGMEVDENSSSDSEDNDEDSKLESRAKELEQQLENYAYSYDSHVELVGIYKKLMDLTQMRKAFERFKDIFPLTPTLWLDWIKDEIRVACSEQEKKYILTLFEQAVKDYLSVDLWLEYVQFSVGSNTAEDTRKIFESAISEVGLHVSKGSLIWDAYREFELAHLSCLADSNTEEWETQAKRVSEVFRRQLSVTLLDMERTYIEWRVWVERLPKNDFVNKEQGEWAYKNAGKYMDDYKDYEERVVSDDDKLAAYRDYIKYERKPEIIRCLFERAIAESSLDTDIWLEYCMYFYKLDNYQTCVKTCERALRNCPWGEGLWIFLMRAQELSGETHDDVTKTLEKALSNGFQSGTQYLQVWLAYLEHFRRITDPKDEKSVEKLRSAFLKGFEHLTKSFGNDADLDCTLLRLWARIEANFLKNMQEARKIWNDYGILKLHGTIANFWLELIELERYHGDEKHVRKTYQRALTATRDWPQCIVQSWLMYERENGTAETIINCMNMCSKHISKFETEVVNTENNEVEDQNRKRKHDTEKPYHKTKHGKVNKEKKEVKPKDVEMKERKPKTEKRKVEAEDKSMEVDEKRHEKIDPERQKRSVFISNLDYKATEEDLTKFLGDIEELRLIKDHHGNSRGFAYAIFPTQEQAEKTLLRDRERLNDRPVFISKCNTEKTQREKQFKYANCIEQHKLFVKGIPMTMSEEEVAEIFKPYGDLECVRLVVYRNGKSKGLAYVEYKNSADAAKAVLATNNLEVRGFTLSVAISAPPERKNVDGERKERFERRPFERERPIEAPKHAKPRIAVPLVPTVVKINAAKATTTLTNEDFRKMLLNEK